MKFINLVSVVCLAFLRNQCCYGQDQYDDTDGSGICECPSECLCTSTKIECFRRSLTTIPLEFKACDWSGVETL